MDKITVNILKEFDEYLVEACARPDVAADRLSCIVGVLIDVKPACVIDFSKFDFEEKKRKDFEKYLRELDLVFYYEKTELGNETEFTFTHTYYISKDDDTLNMLVDTQHELYDHFNTDEPNSPIIKIIHKKIGRLLGYPETATDWFLIRQEKMDLGEMENDDVYKDLQNYYHFIHSRNNSEEEFEEYDKPIHEAMEKYTPLSAELMREHACKRRWL